MDINDFRNLGIAGHSMGDKSTLELNPSMLNATKFMTPCIPSLPCEL